MVLYDAEEIFSIFNTIKPYLNEIIVNGILTFSRENYHDLAKLIQKLEKMHLNTLNQHLESFLTKMDLLLRGEMSKELKKELAKNILQIITIIRMFERITTLECIKNNLLKKEEK
ncbi:MAG: hypothetical protein ACFFAK_10295 [Promethearchaeota archaeon]